MAKVLISLLMLFSSLQVNAQSEWIEIERSLQASTLINKKSISTDRHLTSAWVKWQLIQPLSKNSKTKILWGDRDIHAFAFNKTYDCKSRSAAINVIGIYDEKNIFFSPDELKESKKEFTIAAPDSDLYNEISSVCLFAKNGKIDSGNWLAIDTERFVKHEKKLSEIRNKIKTEQENGTYGPEGLLSKIGLQRIAEIYDIEQKIETLANLGNLKAIVYTGRKAYNTCHSELDKEKEKYFFDIESCRKTHEFSMLGSAKNDAESIMMNGYLTYMYFDKNKHLLALTNLYKIDSNKLSDDNREFLTSLVEKLESSLTSSEVKAAKSKIGKTINK